MNQYRLKVIGNSRRKRRRNSDSAIARNKEPLSRPITDPLPVRVLTAVLDAHPAFASITRPGETRGSMNPSRVSHKKRFSVTGPCCE
ncbi:hypothetical protein NPIL_547951 [Nephila pilipes]|uniref:Uncharacterized protein n=1 Tax=Nephila pilipes TaxID=299642 RepID=A0A8X6PSZ4_NEPPI|nr:hypothetical protein NPIL_547951 [Nephila pilipes]